MPEAAVPGLSLCFQHARGFLGGGRFEFGPRLPDLAFARWWLDAALPGDALRYYAGSGLAEAARGDPDPDLAELAVVLLHEASLTLWRRSPCRHARGLTRGRGRVALV